MSGVATRCNRTGEKLLARDLRAGDLVFEAWGGVAGEGPVQTVLVLGVRHEGENTQVEYIEFTEGGTYRGTSTQPAGEIFSGTALALLRAGDGQ